MRHVAIITSRPKRSGKASIPDGAVTGNGDLAVILGNSPEGMRVFLSKTDVWYAVEKEADGGLRPCLRTCALCLYLIAEVWPYLDPPTQEQAAREPVAEDSAGEGENHGENHNE